MKKLSKIFSLVFAFCGAATLFTACEKNTEHEKIAAEYFAALSRVTDGTFACYGEFDGSHVMIFGSDYVPVFSEETVDGIRFIHPQSNSFTVCADGSFYRLKDAFDNGLLTHDNLLTLRNKYNPHYAFGDTIKDSIVLTISTEKQAYGSGEEILIDVTLENKSGADLKIAFNGPLTVPHSSTGLFPAVDPPPFMTTYSFKKGEVLHYTKHVEDYFSAGQHELNYTAGFYLVWDRPESDVFVRSNTVTFSVSE